MTNQILFKTKQDAMSYINENYPEVATGSFITRPAYFDDDAEFERVPRDLYYLCGGAVEIENSDFEVLKVVGWVDDGTDTYELFVNNNLSATFSSVYDADKAFEHAVELEENKLNDEDMCEVSLLDSLGGERSGWNPSI